MQDSVWASAVARTLGHRGDCSSDHWMPFPRLGDCSSDHRTPCPSQELQLRL